MNIAVAGTGYVGLSLAVLLARRNRALTMDVVLDKVVAINAGRSPIADAEIDAALAGGTSTASSRQVKLPGSNPEAAIN